MKKFISMMMIFLLVSVPGQYLAATAKQPQKLGAQINNTIAIAAATGANQQGTALMYVVLQGQPAKLAVVDIVKNELIDTKNLGDSTSAWGLMVDKSNTVWIGGTPTEHLYSYNPDTRVLKDCGKASGKLSSSIHDLEEGPNGEIYGGTSYGGNVFKYVKGKGFTDLGQVWPAKQSVRSLAINKNVLFAGLGSKAELVAWNLTTKKKQSILPAKYHSQTSVLDLKLAGGILFAKVDPDKKILTFDANTFAFLGEFQAASKTVSELSLDGKSVYFTKDYHLYSKDVSTGRAEAINGTLKGTEAVSLNVIDLHDSRYPGYSVIGLLGNTGTFSIYNKETNQLLIQKLPLPAQEVPIYNIEKGADGSIYSSGFVSGQMTVLNPVTNETTVLKNVGQAEGMASLNGKMYFGIYPGAHLFEYDPTRKETLPRELFAVGNGQERPVAMVGVPGVNKLYIGTYPKSGEYGGALVTYDVKSGAKTVRRNLVPNQSIISLANFNGYVYGGTSIFSGKDLAGKRSALFFRMKAGNPNAKIEALPLAIKFPRMIHALAVGNDKRIWGLSDGNIFAYDPATKVTKTVKVVPNTSGRFRNGSLAVGKDGYIYGAVEKKLFRVQSKTMKLEFLTKVPAEDLAIGEDGRIYFSEHANLWTYQP